MVDMSDAEKLLSEVADERIVLGDCPEAELAGAFSGAARVLVFSGGHSAELSGALVPLDSAARLAGCRLTRWSGVEPEPCIDTVAAMREVVADVRPDRVVAVGGGSVMDAAKAAWLMFQTGWSIDRHFGVNTWSSAHPGVALKRIIAMPTTSGTGSEATAYSNIVDRGRGVKKLIVEEQTVPELALVSPVFAATQNRRLTLATGCDALAHLIEGFLNVGADVKLPRANEWALSGIRLICRHLPVVLRTPGNIESRRNMSVAATLGGMVIRYKSTGLPHLCSFSWFGRLEHGLAVVMLLPECWRYYLGNPRVAERTMALAEFFPGTTPEAVINSFRDFLDALGVPPSLASCPSITPELLTATAAGAAENRMKLELAPNPVPLELSREILTGILERSC